MYSVMDYILKHSLKSSSLSQPVEVSAQCETCEIFSTENTSEQNVAFLNFNYFCFLDNNFEFCNRIITLYQCCTCTFENSSAPSTYSACTVPECHWLVNRGGYLYLPWITFSGATPLNKLPVS